MSSSLVLYCLVLLTVPSADDRVIQPLDARVQVFENVHVVPMDREEVLENRSVVIRDGRIEAIGDAGEITVPAGAIRIAGEGRYLLPGLADMHVHLLDPADFVLNLALGVTTVCNMAGAPVHLELRAALDAGEAEGPILHTTGPMVESSAEPLFNTAFAIRTPEEAVLHVARCKQSGYDFVKMHGDPPAEVYEATMKAAREQRIRVVGHPSDKSSLLRALELGQATIEHAEEFIYCHFRDDLDEAKIPAIAKATRDSGAYVTPTLVTYATITQIVTDITVLQKRPELSSYAAWKQVNWGPERNQHLRNLGTASAPRLRAALAFQRKLVRALHEAGVPLMTGTDYGGPSFLLPGFDLHAELRELVRCGLTPFEAIQAATVNPARHLGDAAGWIREGRRADLILVDENPLEDVDHLARPAGVMVRGRWLSRSDLDQRLEALRRGLEAEEQFLTVLRDEGVEAARKRFREIREASPDEPFVCSLTALGFQAALELMSGRPQAALPITELAVEIYPDSYLSHDLFGKLCARAGRLEEARRHLARSLELNPNNWAAETMLESLPGR